MRLMMLMVLMVMIVMAIVMAIIMALGKWMVVVKIMNIILGGRLTALTLPLP